MDTTCLGHLPDIEEAPADIPQGTRTKFRFRPVRHNLLPHQRRTIGYIKSNSSLVVVQTDKGLGPGAIEPREYIRYATRDHLGDKRTYQRLTPVAVSYRAIKVQKML